MQLFMKTAALLWLAVFVMHSSARGDSPAAPVSYVVSSPDGGRFFLAVFPVLAKEPQWSVILREPYAALFEPQADGTFKELWRIKDFYSFQCFLTSDGKYMAAMGPWNQGQTLAKEDVAISFYEDGKLVKTYSVLEVIDDPNSVRASVSHYQWTEGYPEYPKLEDHLFLVKTTEGVVHFGMDGKLISKDRKVTMPLVKAALLSNNEEFATWGFESIGTVEGDKNPLLPDVIKRLDDPNDYIRDAAISALPFFRDRAKEAIPKFRQMTKSSNETIRDAGKWGLEDLQKEAH